MKANVFKERIKKAFSNREFIKIIFQYPASSKATIKRGVVVSVEDNGFEFEEIYDGLVAYAYDYIVEVKGDWEPNYNQEMKGGEAKDGNI